MSSSSSLPPSAAMTSASFLELCGKKHKSKMGSTLNENVATGPNEFARKQLLKLGWTEGTGLGKNRDGMKTHIRVSKKFGDEQCGIGSSSAANNLDPVVTGDQWWKSSVGNTLARLSASKDAKKKKKKKKKKNRKSMGCDDDDQRSVSDNSNSSRRKTKKRKIIYTDEEIFQATGGARFGMRAQTQQRGKWNRAEKKLTDEEINSSKQRTEWDGISAPKVVLNTDTSKNKRRKVTSSKSTRSSSSSINSEEIKPKSNDSDGDETRVDSTMVNDSEVEDESPALSMPEAKDDGMRKSSGKKQKKKNKKEKKKKLKKKKNE